MARASRRIEGGSVAALDDEIRGEERVRELEQVCARLQRQLAQAKAKTWRERARDSRLFSNYCNARLTATLTTDSRHEKRNLLAVAAIGELIVARGGRVPESWQVDVFGKYMGEGAIK